MRVAMRMQQRDSTCLCADCCYHHFFNIDTGQLFDIPSEQLNIESIPQLPQDTKIQDLEIVIKVKNKKIII